MVQPIDYRLNVANPIEAAATGYQLGSSILANQKAQLAQDQAMQMRDDLTALSKNPTPAAIAQISVRYPQLSEQFKRSFDMLSQEQRQNKTDQLLPVYAAALNGQPDIAAQKLNDIATAQENAGDKQSAQGSRDLATMFQQHPENAKTLGGLYLSNLMGPDKFTQTFTALQTDKRNEELQPSALSEAQSKAQQAAVASKFAESNAAQDLAKKGWDIYKIQQDVQIAKRNSDIAAMNARIAGETNGLKRQELGMQLLNMQRDRDNQLAAKTADLETNRNSIDNALTTMDRILKTPAGVVRNATGPIDSRTPTLQSDTADFEELVKGLDAQAFLSQVPSMKGLGALSDIEGKKLTAALQNFSLRQSDKQFLGNVQEAQRLLLKARENLAKRNGMPDTLPDRPQAQVQGLPQGFKILGKE